MKFDTIYDDLIKGTEKLALVGLGYVGMPIAVEFAKHISVIGFDINEKRVNEYASGIDATNEVGEAIKNTTVDFTSDPTRLKEAKFIVVAVPTPVNPDTTPDLRPVEGASRTVGQNLTPGTIVVFESTVYPGVTEDICIPIIEKESGLKCGVDFFLDTPYQNLALLLDIPIIKSGTKDEVSPPGTGPYEFAETKLTRCKNWWRDTPPLVDFDEIALTVSSTAADVRDNFEYQKVNMVLTDPNSSAFAGFHNDFELWNEETTIMQYIGYNMNSPVFSNYGLRGAIPFAIAREQLVGQTLGGFAVASTLPCSPNSRYYDVKLANNFAYDTGSYYDQLASASVEDATGDGILDLYVPSKGYSVPVEGTMIVCSSSYIRVQAANEVARMLNSLGFNITVKSMEYSEYKQALLQGNFDLYYGEVRLSPNFDLSPFFGATGTLNYGDLADSTMMNLCSMALVNSGNTYNLYKRVCERGYITPILFKSYALYTTRGAVTEPTHYIDWFLPYTPEEGN